MNIIATRSDQPWKKRKLVGQKTPLKLIDIWAIRVSLQIAERTRDLALFNLSIDSKLRACDLIKLRVRDVAHSECVSPRAVCYRGLDTSGTTPQRRPPFSEQVVYLRSSIHALVRSYRQK